jgi:hypothetical protein
MTGKTVDQLIAEGDLIEAGRQAGRDIRARMMGGLAEPKHETVEERRRRRTARDEQCRNDLNMGRHRGARGYGWRETEDAMWARHAFWQLAESKALEAARAAYKDELRLKAQQYLEVIEGRLAELKAKGFSDDDGTVWYLNHQRRKLKLWAEGRRKPTPDRVREQTRERVRRLRARRRAEQLEAKRRHDELRLEAKRWLDEQLKA